MIVHGILVCISILFSVWMFNTLLSVMLCIAVLKNEVCTAWNDAFFVLASNGTTDWLCLVKGVSFIFFGG